MTTNKQSTKKGAKKGSVGSKRKAAQIDAEAEAFKREAVAYAKRAYDAALAHYEKHHAQPFILSRLAVVYDEQRPGDFHLVVTLPGVMRDSHVDDNLLGRWITDTEILTRALEHPKCSKAFAGAFGAVFTDEMLDSSGISWTTPEVVRVMLPLVMLAGSGTNHVCDDDTALRILLLLCEELNDDETYEEVRASVIRA